MDRINLDIDYMESYKYVDRCECESCRYFYREFKNKYKKTTGLLEELRVKIDYPLALMEYGDGETGREYLVHYELKGLLLESFSLDLEGLKINFISSDFKDSFWPSPSFEKPYFILEIDKIII